MLHQISQKQLLHHLSYMWNLQTSNLYTRIEEWLLVAWVRSRGWGVVIKWYKLSLYKNKGAFFQDKEIEIITTGESPKPSDHKIHLSIILLLLVTKNQKISYSCIFPKIFLQINHQRKVHSISFWIYDLRTWHVWKVPYDCFQHAVSILSVFKITKSYLWSDHTHH